MKAIAHHAAQQYPVDTPPPRPTTSDDIGHEMGIDLGLFCAVIAQQLGYTGAPTLDEPAWVQTGLAYLQSNDINQHVGEQTYVLAIGLAHMTWDTHYF